MKIKDKETRRLLMDEVLECKKKSSTLMEVLGKAANMTISNEMVAQLNDMAYKAIRKGGVAKKLDERAIKNEAYFKKIEAQIKAQIKKTDFDQVEKERKEIIEQIGACPMSVNNSLEAM